MTEPVFHQGIWWVQHANGSWSRWDDSLKQWLPHGWVAQPPPRYSPLRTLAKWIVIALVADLVVGMITIIVNVGQLASVERGERVAIEEYIEASAGTQVMMQLGGAVSSVAGLLFVVWFYRAYQNLLSVRTRGRYGSGWALGAWFVPILNLWRPKQIADDIWRTSDPSLPPEPGTVWLEKKVDPLLNWWWASWVLANTVALIVMPVSFITELSGSDFFDADSSEPSFTPMIRALSITIVATTATRILAAPLAIAVVKRITERQEARATQLDVPREV